MDKSKNQKKGMYVHRLQNSVAAKDLHMRHRDTDEKEIFLKIKQANIYIKLSKYPAKQETEME